METSISLDNELLTLDDRIAENRKELVSHDGLVAYPYHWQVPAATEKAAYESIAALKTPLAFDYFGFPWATVIDGLRGDAANTWSIMFALNSICERPKSNRKRVTVAQHIHAMQFIDIFKECGITDIFWSHKIYQQSEIDGIRLHPFPLFPAQTQDVTILNDLHRPRKYLANFIGAYDPIIYLSNVREVIFNSAGKYKDILIIKREAWHFDRAVYEEQIKGVSADAQRLLLEKKHKEEYLNAISNSWFTLCPTGSGPNSIRIFESLCLGSIPIVLTRDLHLPGAERLWNEAAVIEEDSESGYKRAIAKARALSIEKRASMLLAGQALFKILLPSTYADFIIKEINEVPSSNFGEELWN